MNRSMNAPGTMDAPGQEAVKPWWKHSMVWMVIGGPLAVVVACVITWFVIMRAPDQVLSQSQEVESKQLAQEKGTSYAPSQKARNHAATGYQPADN